MKGLILSGGKGTRLRPLTYTRAKQLLPLANKPVLFYGIESLLEAGITDIGIVVGDTHEEIRRAVGDGSRWGDAIRITFIQQEAPLGLAHAVLSARSFLGDDRFVMALGDNLVGEPLTPIVQEFGGADCSYHCRIMLTHVEHPSEFGVAELEEQPPPAPVPAPSLAPVLAGVPVATARTPERRLARADTPTPTPTPTPMPIRAGEATTLTPGTLRVRRLIEKPKHPPSDLALVGIYCFDHHIFVAAESIQPSARGELEITDAIQWLIDTGYQVRPYLLHSYWIDTGKMEDVLAANRLVLAGLTPSVHPSVVMDHTSVLQGQVTVQAGAVIRNSIIRGPAIIGERVRVENAYVGPFSSIYHDAVIEGSEIEYCILLENSRITNVPVRIEASLIGRHAEVYSSAERPRAHRLMLGDHSRLTLQQG